MSSRDDVMILFHTPRSRRQIWVNPFKIESVVEQQPLWNINGEYMTRDEAKRRYQNVIDARPKGDLTPTQINMDSGDQGAVRESIGEVMARIQKAYEINWEAAQDKDSEEAEKQD